VQNAKDDKSTESKAEAENAIKSEETKDEAAKNEDKPTTEDEVEDIIDTTKDEVKATVPANQLV
jgi:hypothetical protein